MVRRGTFLFSLPRGLRWLPLCVVILLLIITAWRAYESPPRRVNSSRTPGSAIAADAPVTVFVERVIDGDTLAVDGNQRVRLLGVDTPETVKPEMPVQPWGPEASEFAKRHVEGKMVRLEFDREKHDRYNRVLAYVYVGEWFLNEELIRAGLSPAVTKYPFRADMKQRFRAAEEQARRNKVGIWSGGR